MKMRLISTVKTALKHLLRNRRIVNFKPSHKFARRTYNYLFII
jgi:hypothetical protein